VIIDRARADEQLCGDVLVRCTLGRAAGDLCFLGDQVVACLGGAFAGVLAGSLELDPSAFGERLHAEPAEQLVGAAQLLAVQPPFLAAQPFAVEEVGAGELHDGLVTSETTEVDYTGGKILPGEFENFPLTLSIPDSAKQGDVISFPTVQTYSNGHVVRWIGAPTADTPAPTVDITAAGGALLDVTGGDAGPPSPLPANLTGASKSGAAAPVTTIVKKQNSGLAIIALIAGALGLILGAAALATRRKNVGMSMSP
jgi:hypothetical protein